MLSIPASPSARDSSAQDVGGLIERGLKSSFWQLRLPDGLEQRYLLDSIAARVQHTKRSGWFALFVFNSFLVVDWLMVPDVFWTAVLIRVGLFSPLGTAVLLAGNQLARTAAARGWINIADWMSLLSGWCAALSLALVLFLSHSPWVHYYHAGFLVIIIYGNLVQQLRFPFAVLFSGGVLGVHMAGVVLARDFPPGVRVAMVVMLVLAAAFTLVANYLVERATRRRYLLARRDARMVDELSALNARLQTASRSDVLTGVANRRHLHAHLMQAVERARAGDGPLSLLMLDVDHFKAYNDRHGHPAGDECLRQVARALQAHLRHPSDLVARFGGEEFAIVMSHADGPDALAAAQRIREAVQALGIPHEALPTQPVVTTCVGVATMRAGDALMSAERLVSQADQALYDAKHAGRNCARAFQQSDSPT